MGIPFESRSNPTALLERLKLSSCTRIRKLKARERGTKSKIKMSNKVVPQIYRQVIDDVIASIQVDFEEYGMEEEILNALQAKWEAKLLESRVADFNRAPGAPSTSGDSPPPTSQTSPLQPVAGPSRSMQHGVLAMPGRGPNGGGMIQGWTGEIKQDPEDVLRVRGGAARGEDLKAVKSEVKPEPNAAGLLPGDEVIDSDLDDSDDEQRDDGDEEGEADLDIVFCTYDKVQRVKNKWKTVFKDGMIHINGKDYLFSKCNGEFEW